ncbi:cytochrome c oxidase assembly protein [Agrococcus sp. Marseille-P2731]|uniref:cytochrome c oxidase assembly protein n=1 Tax=Agrococcus sp. Marseille-P2731 TaxID=1841862 RepID=UPI0009FB7B1B|nr:cytochrome c oxidase assembly protein [Agrococcus sp. Marseille-P2731]
MTLAAPMHPHHASGSFSLDLVLIGIAVAAAALYALGVIRAGRRGRRWPAYRTICWILGIAAATVSVAGPLAAAAHSSFVAHMWAHLLVGMLAPLLLVAAAPVTLALRALDVLSARQLSRLLRTRPVRVVAHPLTAALLNAGGLWLIYLTPLFALMQSSQLMHVAVHAHLLLAGYLFTAAVIGVDPNPHRLARPWVAGIVVLTMASHSILAKHLYANPPAAVPVLEAHDGAQLMYYAGAWLEAAIVVIFCAQWYRASGIRERRRPRSEHSFNAAPRRES